MKRSLELKKVERHWSTGKAS